MSLYTYMQPTHQTVCVTFQDGTMYYIRTLQTSTSVWTHRLNDNGIGFYPSYCCNAASQLRWRPGNKALDVALNSKELAG